MTNTTPIRWTEKELVAEITSLEQPLIDEASNQEEAGCARAYLRQVLKDRRATLRLLQFRNKQAQPAAESKDLPSLNWPMPRPVSSFQPLLQV